MSQNPDFPVTRLRGVVLTVPALCLGFILLLALTGETAGQTIYQYKDDSGAVVISDRPPEKKTKSVKEFKYKEGPSDPAPRPAGPGPETGVKIGAGQQPPLSPQQMEKQRIEEGKKAAADQRARREEAAQRIEEEAKKPMPYSRENVAKQIELLEKAHRVRTGQEPLPAP